MLSNIFHRILTSVRPIQNYQQHFLRLLSTIEPMSTEKTSNNRETGVVKRFSKDKGYGFITKTSDGTDYFVHFKNISGTGFKTLDQGQEVEFTTVQGEKGLEARDVSIINTGTSGMSSMNNSSYNNSTSSRFGFGGSQKRQSSSVYDYGGSTSLKFREGKQDSTTTTTERNFDFNTGLTNSSTDNLFSSKRTSIDSDRKRQIGSIKRWSKERGFGFIRRTNGGPDLFCHVRSLQDGLQSLEEGQTVEYRIQKTDKGEEARNVTLLNDESFTTQQEENSFTTNSNQRQTGTVKRWLSEKNYGFIRRDDSGSDLFVHLRDLTDGNTSLEEGQFVEFDIKLTEKGDMAQNVVVRNNT